MRRNCNIIFENETLLKLISLINGELIDVEDYSKLRLVSKNHPNCIVLQMQMDITEDIKRYFANGVDFAISEEDLKNIQIECECNDFIVLALEKTETSITMKNFSLFELLIASKEMLSDKDGIHNMKDSEGWSLDTNDWTLIEII